MVSRRTHSTQLHLAQCSFNLNTSIAGHKRPTVTVSCVITVIIKDAWFRACVWVKSRSSLFRVGSLFIDVFGTWIDWRLKFGPTSCPETSVHKYQWTLRKDPEERRFQGQRCSELTEVQFTPDYPWADLIFRPFRKPVQKLQSSLKSDNNNGYFTWRRFHICDDISLNSS